jgi:hypothetical protein
VALYGEYIDKEALAEKSDQKVNQESEITNPETTDESDKPDLKSEESEETDRKSEESENKMESVDGTGWKAVTSQEDPADVSAWGSVSAPSESWNSGPTWAVPGKNETEKPFEISTWGSGSGTGSWKPIECWSPASEDKKSEPIEDSGTSNDDEVTIFMTTFLTRKFYLH